MKAQTKILISFLSIIFGAFVVFGLFSLQAPQQESFVDTSSPNLLTPNKSLVAKPTLLVSSIQYNGQEHNIQEALSGFEQDTMTLSGDIKKTNASSSYVLVVTLKDPENFEWNDGGTSPNCYLGWQITPIKVTEPKLADDLNLIYNKSEQEIAFKSPLDLTVVTLSGDIKKINAGNYTAKVSLNDKTNYVWEKSETSTDLEFDWSIKQSKLVVPKLKQKKFVFTGQEINLKDYFDWFDDEVLALDSYGKATNVGIYKTKLSLRDYYNYSWDNSTTGDIEIFWEIESRTNTLPVILVVLIGTPVLAILFFVLTTLIDPKRRSEN